MERGGGRGGGEREGERDKDGVGVIESERNEREKKRGDTRKKKKKRERDQLEYSIHRDRGRHPSIIILFIATRPCLLLYLSIYSRHYLSLSLSFFILTFQKKYI